MHQHVDLVSFPVAFSPTLPAASGLVLLLADTTSPALAGSVLFADSMIAASSGEVVLAVVLLLLGGRSAGKPLMFVSM